MSEEFELQHHGVKGQKWGIRRYQNSDGSLTEEGKIRYGVGEDGKMSEEGKQLYDADRKERKRNIAIGVGIGAAVAAAGALIVSKIVKSKIHKETLTTETVSMGKSKTEEVLLLTAGNKVPRQHTKFKGEPSLFGGKRGGIGGSYSYSGPLGKGYNIHTGRMRKMKHSCIELDAFLHSDDDEEELQHHGIKGQKWGERRFQNPDGSLTEEGKDRYGVGSSIKKNSAPKVKKEESTPKVKNDDKEPKWGLRRFQNKDGTLTDAGKARYNEQLAKIKEIGDTQAKLEALKREITKDWDGKSKILVPKDVKSEYDKLLDKWKKAVDKYSKEEIYVDIKTMDDGADYIVSKIYDKDLDGFVEYYSLVKHSDNDFNDYLQHHGIKGQKWGLRRFQKPDGSLTEEGKKRYNADSYDKMDSANKAKYDEDRRDYKLNNMNATSDILRSIGNATSAAQQIPITSGKTIRKSYPNLTDKELQERINRLSLEQRYSDLKGDTKYERSGGERVREILQTVGASVAIAGSVAAIAATVYGMRHQIPGSKKGKKKN